MCEGDNDSDSEYDSGVFLVIQWKVVLRDRMNRVDMIPRGEFHVCRFKVCEESEEENTKWWRRGWHFYLSAFFWHILRKIHAIPI